MVATTTQMMTLTHLLLPIMPQLRIVVSEIECPRWTTLIRTGLPEVIRCVYRCCGLSVRLRYQPNQMNNSPKPVCALLDDVRVATSPILCNGWVILRDPLRRMTLKIGVVTAGRPRSGSWIVSFST